MEKKDTYDAIIFISCRRGQVLDIIGYIKSMFPDVEVSYEVFLEEDYQGGSKIES